MKPIYALKTEGMTVPPGFTDPEEATKLLRTYYLARLQEKKNEEPWYRPGASRGYVGAYFDRWESTPPGEGEDPDVDQFTTADIMAVQMLSVRVPGWAALDLVERRREFFSDLLTQIPADVDLWEDGERAEDAVNAALKLEKELRRYHQIGATTAAKLIARKRPRLYPIYDSVVVRELNLDGRLFRELRKELQKNEALRDLCLQLREAVGLPASISILRVFDVVTWMGKDAGTHRLEERVQLEDVE